MATPIEILILAEMNTIGDAMYRAKQLSSGTYSTEILSKPIWFGGWGHPYGIKPGYRKTPPPYPNQTWEGLPAKINKQTGTFYSRWNFSAPIVYGNIMICSIFNTAPQADELATGNEVQMKRPLPDLVGYMIEKKRLRNIVEAIVTSGDLGIQVRF